VLDQPIVLQRLRELPDGALGNLRSARALSDLTEALRGLLERAEDRQGLRVIDEGGGA
jgi:hypothetical protein